MTMPVPLSMLEESAWRAGVDVHHDVHPSPTSDGPELLAELDDLAPPPRKRPEGVHSITHLIAKKRMSRDLDHFKKSVRAVLDTDTATLVLMFHTTQDPLKLWSIHVVLDGRDIPPALRWPANTDTEQAKFINWLADLLWFTRRNPEHKANFRGWQRLMAETPGSPIWLEQAYWIFAAMYGSQNVCSYTARGLALSHDQRQDLMMLPTSRMVTARLQLQQAPFSETRQRLLSHAVTHPDRSRKHTPDAIAQRRAGLWRTHILSGRSPTTTTENWRKLTGKSISRQKVSEQIATVKSILKSEAPGA
jgi:hypothetical protein